MLTCLNDQFGPGKTCEKRYPVSVYIGMFLFRPGFKASAMTDLGDRDWWLQEIANGNIIPVQRIKNVSPEDVEDGEPATSIGDIDFAYEGKRGATYSTAQPLESHKQLRELNGLDFDVVYVDVNKTVIVSKNDDDLFGGIELGYFRVKKLPTTSSDVIPYSMIKLQEADNDDLDRRGYYFNPSWNPTKLFGPNKVTLFNSVVLASVWTTEVKAINNGKLDQDGNYISQNIPGLIETENWNVWDDTGVLLTPTTDYTAVEQASTGIYDFDATTSGLTIGEIQAKPSVDAMFQSEKAELTA